VEKELRIREGMKIMVGLGCTSGIQLTHSLKACLVSTLCFFKCVNLHRYAAGLSDWAYWSSWFATSYASLLLVSLLVGR
jgi:hypothetical protein